jgi:hypothetical protein
LGFDEPSSDCEAEAGAAASGGIVSPEPIEHAAGRLGGEAAAGVLDADGDVILGGGEPHGDRAVRWGVLEGVGEQVQENTFDLVWCAANERRVAEMSIQGHAACSSDGFDTAQTRIDKGGDGDDLKFV